MDARAKKAKTQLGRAAKLVADPKKQAGIIRTKIHAGAFHGIETADYTDRQIAEMSSATVDASKKRNNRHDADWFYTLCSAGKDLDPAVQIPVRRVVGLRRARAKRPQQQKKMHKILNLYARRAGQSRWLYQQGEGPDDFHEPVPHPSRGSSKQWRSVVVQEGPIGLLIQSVYSI